MAVRFIFVTFSYFLISVHGHGMLYDPPNRSSMWRFGHETPPNYNDNGNRCGGVFNEHGSRRIECGVCGDDYRQPKPRPNELGGKYGLGIIGKKYYEGSNIQVTVRITASHLGKFTFDLCNLDEGYEIEECFERHPLKLVDGSDSFEISPESNRATDYLIVLTLPEGVTCDHCVLRWQYIAGNNWGRCRDVSGRLTSYGRNGCGPQETFRTCSDISIVPYAGRNLHEKNGESSRKKFIYWDYNTEYDDEGDYYSLNEQYGWHENNDQEEAKPKSMAVPTAPYYNVIPY